MTQVSHERFLTFRANMECFTLIRLADLCERCLVVPVQPAVAELVLLQIDLEYTGVPAIVTSDLWMSMAYVSHKWTGTIVLA